MNKVVAEIILPVLRYLWLLCFRKDLSAWLVESAGLVASGSVTISLTGSY
jgi:hypothetical protein